MISGYVKCVMSIVEYIIFWRERNNNYLIYYDDNRELCESRNNMKIWSNVYILEIRRNLDKLDSVSYA